MKDWKDYVRDELDELKRVRDEAAVQAHLAKAEAKDKLDELEHSFQHAEARWKVVAQQAAEEGRDVGEALKLVVEELSDGFKKVKQLLP